MLFSPIPLRVVPTTNGEQIGEQQPEKKAQSRNSKPVNDKRRTAAVGPAGLSNSWDLVHQPHKLAALKIVGRPGKEDVAGEGVAMQVTGDLRHFIINKGVVDAAFDLCCETISAPKWAMPQSGKDQRRDHSKAECRIASGGP